MTFFARECILLVNFGVIGLRNNEEMGTQRLYLNGWIKVVCWNGKNGLQQKGLENMTVNFLGGEWKH